MLLPRSLLEYLFFLYIKCYSTNCNSIVQEKNDFIYVMIYFFTSTYYQLYVQWALIILKHVYPIKSSPLYM